MRSHSWDRPGTLVTGWVMVLSSFKGFGENGDSNFLGGSSWSHKEFCEAISSSSIVKTLALSSSFVTWQCVENQASEKHFGYKSACQSHHQTYTIGDLPDPIFYFLPCSGQHIEAHSYTSYAGIQELS